MDLRKLDVSEDWKCENKTVLNTYRISIKASTTDTLRREYTGPSSKYITVQPPCSGSNSLYIHYIHDTQRNCFVKT